MGIACLALGSREPVSSVSPHIGEKDEEQDSGVGICVFVAGGGGAVQRKAGEGEAEPARGGGEVSARYCDWPGFWKSHERAESRASRPGSASRAKRQGHRPEHGAGG